MDLGSFILEIIVIVALFLLVSDSSLNLFFWKIFGRRSEGSCNHFNFKHVCPNVILEISSRSLPWKSRMGGRRFFGNRRRNRIEVIIIIERSRIKLIEDLFDSLRISFFHLGALIYLRRSPTNAQVYSFLYRYSCALSARNVAQKLKA